MEDSGTDSREFFSTGFASRLCYKWRWEECVLLLVALLITPAALYLPVEYTYENSAIENIQMLVLAACFSVCLLAKVDKRFFRCMALLCVIIALREVNCGRTLFFPVEGEPNKFLPWKELPYGYLAHPLFGLFIAGVVVYFFISGSHKVLWRYMLHARIAVWIWLFAVVGVVLTCIGEKCHYYMMEEMAELMFYLALLFLMFFHSRSSVNNGPCGVNG